MKNSYLLEVKNLTVKTKEKIVLKNISLSLKRGETLAILGENGSGKSSLAYALLGLPSYKVVSGKIIFLGKDITKLSPQRRAKLGLALAFQHPVAIEGLKLKTLLSKINRLSLAFEEIDELKKLLDRDLNLNFSGGEKKIAEIFQVIALDPELAILDEIDASLDLERLKRVLYFVKKFLVKKEKGLIIISHRESVLNFFKPQKVSILLDGKIICSKRNWKEVLKIIKKYGYKKCRECALSSDRS